MHPKTARYRIALVEGCDRGEEIGDALEGAGYEVAYAGENEALDDRIDLVVHVTERRSKSGVLGRLGRDVVPPADDTANADVVVVTPKGNDVAEQRLRESERMESIAQLAGGIAHDFNNILSVISICADEVLETMEASHPSRECLVDIRYAVERGAAVTRDLLAFSRRDMSEARLVDFNDVIRASQHAMTRILGDDVTLHVSLDAMNASVNVDAGQWASVLSNLAVNARQAIQGSGSITLRTRVLMLDPATHGRAKNEKEKENRYVELDVTDTGTGIPDDIQARIFDPFFTTKGMGKSTGLGLSVVHGVVERSGGWIEVVSPSNPDTRTGTTFRIYVPIATMKTAALHSDAEGAVTTTAPPSATAPPTTKESKQASTSATSDQEAPVPTLLLVEDEEAMRRIALRMLERQGYRVFHAASAEEGLDMLKGRPPIDLLITDIVLPKMDGRRFADAVVAQYPTIDVLYTSGYTDDEVLRFGVSKSEMHFLQKPYSAKVLVARVQELLAKKTRVAG